MVSLLKETISQEQLEVFQGLKGLGGNSLAGNNRPIQTNENEVFMHGPGITGTTTTTEATGSGTTTPTASSGTSTTNPGVTGTNDGDTVTQSSSTTTTAKTATTTTTAQSVGNEDIKEYSY